MTNLKAMFATDKDLEAGAGVTIDYGQVKFTLHRAGGANKKYASVFSAKVTPYRRQMQAGMLSDEISTKLMAEVYAETVIIGWEGVTDDEGNPLSFSRENVVNALIELPELFAAIQDEANRISNFRAAQVEDEEKN